MSLASPPRSVWLVGVLVAAAAAAAAGEGEGPPDPGVDSLLRQLGASPSGPRIRAKLRDPLLPDGPPPGGSPALRIGEELTFSVRYGPLRAGEATLEIAGVEPVGGVDCLHVVSTAKSNSFFDTFYRVRDRVESWMDRDYLFSRRFRKRLREGGYRADQEIEMDQENGLARYGDGRVFEFVRGAHDVLSAFTYARTVALEPGMVFDMESHVDRKNYPLRVVVHRRERVETPVSAFDCIVIEPMLRTPGLFNREGKLTIWLTDDERRMPVLMKSRIPVGSITVILTGFERPE